MEDARIQKTKARLICALSELMKEYPLDQISVSGLCRKANVNRTTFYKYFRVPSDVAQEAFIIHVRDLHHLQSTSLNHLYDSLLFCCRKYRDNYNRTRQMFPGFVLSEELLSDFYLHLSEPLNLGDDSKLFFVAGGASALMLHWLRDPEACSAEEIARKLSTMIRSVLDGG